MRVLAAMSGGVDSAVAAARAVDAGHDVVGVHLALSRSPATSRTGSRGCCSIEDGRDARRAADTLGIPCYVWDLSERFAADVVEDFAAEYARGRTPNPCMRCNERIKFAALLDRALALGFDGVVTGHYARRIDGPDGVELHRAGDAAKDQSYVLAATPRERLARAWFPLGDAEAKADVRAEAQGRGLAVATKPDSHDVCFVPDGDTAGWLERRLGTAPGPVVDGSGARVGRHSGAHRYTVGQRRGLALERPAPDGRPRYVLRIEPASRTVVVGGRDELSRTELAAERVSWLGPAAEPGARVAAQVRAHGEAVPATVTAVGGELTVTLDEPVHGVAPGQTLVLYDGTRVLGAGLLQPPPDPS